MGLIVSLALCFAALEFSIKSSDDEIDMEMFEEVAQDLEEMSAQDQRDMVPAELPQEAAPQVADKVQEVSDPDISEEPEGAKVLKPVEPPKIVPVEVPSRMEMDITKVPPVILDINDNPANLRIVEDTPKPVGGWVAFMKWLTKALHYPPTAKSQRIQGTVLVTFIVDEEGKVDNVQVKKSIEPSLDREAMRVAKMITRWEPAVKNGKPVKAMVGIPIVFKL